MPRWLLVTIMVLITVVVLGNIFLVFRLFSGNSPLPPMMTYARSVALPLSDRTPVPSSAVTLPPSPVAERAPRRLRDFFFRKEVIFHLRFAKSFTETVTVLDPMGGANPIILRLCDISDIQFERFQSLTGAAESTEVILSPGGLGFLEFTFPKSAREVLQELKLGGDNLGKYLISEGNVLLLGPSTSEPGTRILANEAVTGSGAYAPTLAEVQDHEFYLRLFRSSIDLQSLPFPARLTSFADDLTMSIDSTGLSTFGCNWKEIPEWVGSLAVDERLPICPFIPEDAGFALAMALPEKGDRTPALRELWKVMFQEDADEQEREFRDSLGISPTELATFAKSRLYIFAPSPDEDVSPENIVYGFDLVHNKSVEDILDKFKVGSLFGEAGKMTMLYKGRKIFFPSSQSGEPGFSIASVNNFALLSASNEALCASIDVFGQSKGLAADQSEKGAALFAGSSVVFKLSPKTFHNVFPTYPFPPGTRTILAALRFTREGFRISTPYGPHIWLLPALGATMQHIRL
ncbi:MAG: hypothetical protein WC712_11575 [Candidatus Brocadiia bacterium]